MFFLKSADGRPGFRAARFYKVLSSLFSQTIGRNFVLDFLVRHKTPFFSFLAHTVEGNHGLGLPDGHYDLLKITVRNVHHQRRQVDVIGNHEFPFCLQAFPDILGRDS
jgi:hypothetical protein